MNWMLLALGVLSLCNLAFLLGAAFLLYRIIDATEEGQIQLLKASHQMSESGNHLVTATRRSIVEMERMHDAQAARENSSNRVIGDLANQVRALSGHVDALQIKQTVPAEATHSVVEQETARRAAEDLRAKLRNDLNAALARNHQLQDELAQTQYQLKSASASNADLCLEISDVKGVKQSVVDALMLKTTELEDQLRKAKERAKAAEHHAESNATQLDAIREQLHQQDLAANRIGNAADKAYEVDQSGLIQSQQDMIEVLSAREKKLLERITAMEQAFNRTQTEKDFIEDRFLQYENAREQNVTPVTPTPVP